MQIFKRKAKSRLKKTRQARKAQNKRLKALHKYFRAIPVNFMGETISYIFLDK